MRWQFKGKAPLSIKIVFALMFTNFAGQMASTYAVSTWGLLRPDAVHSFPVHYRGGPTFYVQPWLGEYSDYGFWLHFVLVGIGFLLFLIHHNELERIS